MANPPRRKRKQVKKTQADRASSAQCDASSDESPLAHPHGPISNESHGQPDAEQNGSALRDLQKELGVLKRTERDAFERAREEEIANPTSNLNSLSVTVFAAHQELIFSLQTSRR
ncbi:hypothetical protein EVJ58_g10325 [Rhodofomes roseus]|uniref:Uncharacterized protein n=1 Tax=Rhodofomes roseus TaxID=34475 RepID=A0A4Y9XP53_9APHY|nr:hypothetical protein EVJ58_g10325 [Rhodofomes roseus]